ncbi:MAG: lysine--tRNA ligase [Acholeplasmatales bacterium]|jgi:lysyl-tRNA synthetase class 2|nr:lysine--tRNA ligase [Acholeplasmatales bacterium]
MKKDFNIQQLFRIEKLNKLKEMGVDPFGSRYERTHLSSCIKTEYEKYDTEELASLNVNVSVAGRIILKRGQGKAGFLNLLDKDGNIQIYVKLDNVGEKCFEIFKESDLGDIIGVSGVLFRTHTNELTVRALVITHLSKAITPLPDKFHGLQDKEEARRRRYVDLIVNEESRKTAITRSKILKYFREYFDNNGYLEVETPVLQSVLGGASARPFVTHHNTLDQDYYLRIATELPLKRLIVGGLEKVYEIGRLFRNEGMDAKHNPEFTTVEAYAAYCDVHDMMNLAEDCLKYVTYKTLGSYEISYQGIKLDMTNFKKISMVDSIKEVTGVDFNKIITLTEAKKIAKKHNVAVLKHHSVGHIIESFFDEFVEKTIIQPTIIYGHPTAISPLAKKNKDNPLFSDRFEIFINGAEYGNAFSELNDPLDQYERFENQLKEKALGNAEASELDNDFIEALEYGLPPTGGIGIGIDRFVMLLTDNANIRDVILFPLFKR